MKVRLAGLAFFVMVIPSMATTTCENAQDQNALNQCAADEYAAADQVLNATYKQIAKRLSDDQPALELLKKAQRAWFTFRDEECAFSSSAARGGSIEPMIIANCKTRITNDRNKQLLDYLSCEEGDLSCPVPQ